MRPVLQITCVILVWVGIFSSQLSAHPASCSRRGCGCGYLGLAPAEFRVETNQRDEILVDWLLQDGMGEGLEVKSLWKLGRTTRTAMVRGADHVLDPAKVRAVVESLGDGAGELRSECTALKNVPAKDPRWLKLYVAACEKRRELRLQPHRDLLARVVFAKHYEMGGSHYAYTEGLSDAQHEHHFVPGSTLGLLELGDGVYPKYSVLLDDPKGVLRDPDISHDGKRILFAWKKSANEDDYHLYEMDFATKKIRQITKGLGYADYEGVYTGDGNIVFNSTRCIQSVDCWHVEVSNLFTCDLEGKYLRRLGFDQVHTTCPSLTEDGRILYTRWDYNDRGQMAIQALFQMNPDGTAQRELYGNNSAFPTTILHTRSIPGTGKYICILSGHHSRQRGWLAVIDPRKGRQENQGVQLVAPVRETVACVVDAACQSGDQFKHPYPLSEEDFLVSFAQPTPGTHNNTLRSGTRPYGIYYMHIDGSRELLYKDNNISCVQPIPLRPRSIPPRSNMVDYKQETGTIYLHDVCNGPGLHGVKRGTIKRLRVVALEFRVCSGKGIEKGSKSTANTNIRLGSKNRGPMSAGLISTPISGAGGTWDVKTVLGTATVHDDGSACFIVPARTPIFFQALDEKGQMVQSMRSWMTMQPGETSSCIGCHERKNMAPPVPYSSQALAASPETLDRQPFEGPPRGFDFAVEIQPLLDKQCTRCHHGGTGKDASFSLKWPDSYNALAKREVCNWINAQSKPAILPPYHTGAVQSRLIRMFLGGKQTFHAPPAIGETEGTTTTIDGKHYDVKLSDAELQRLITWIDIGIPLYGDYPVPQDNYYRKKRRDWESQEAENIRKYMARQR